MDTKRLGRGVDALFSDSKEDVYLRKVEVDCIRPSTSQPRKEFDQESLQGLAFSIKEQGIIQPLVVEEESDGGLRLIAGERRLRAAKMAGLEEIPVVVREYSDQKRKEVALIENIQREDLNPIEEAEAIQELLSTSDETQEALAERLGLSRTALTNSLRLLRLSKKIRDYIVQGRLSAGHARAVLSISSEKLRLEIANFILERELSVRESEQAAALIRSGKVLEDLHTTPVLSSTSSRQAPSVKREEKKSFELIEVEDKLVELFATRVKVKGSEEKGNIEIPYYSRDDFQRILDLIEKIH